MLALPTASVAVRGRRTRPGVPNACVTAPPVPVPPSPKPQLIDTGGPAVARGGGHADATPAVRRAARRAVSVGGAASNALTCAAYGFPAARPEAQPTSTLPSSSAARPGPARLAGRRNRLDLAERPIGRATREEDWALLGTGRTPRSPTPPRSIATRGGTWPRPGRDRLDDAETPVRRTGGRLHRAARRPLSGTHRRRRRRCSTCPPPRSRCRRCRRRPRRRHAGADAPAGSDEARLDRGWRPCCGPDDGRHPAGIDRDVRIGADALCARRRQVLDGRERRLARGSYARLRNVHASRHCAPTHRGAPASLMATRGSGHSPRRPRVGRRP